MSFCSDFWVEFSYADINIDSEPVSVTLSLKLLMEDGWVGGASPTDLLKLLTPRDSRWCHCWFDFGWNHHPPKLEGDTMKTKERRKDKKGNLNGGGGASGTVIISHLDKS